MVNSEEILAALNNEGGFPAQILTYRAQWINQDDYTAMLTVYAPNGDQDSMTRRRAVGVMPAFAVGANTARAVFTVLSRVTNGIQQLMARSDCDVNIIVIGRSGEREYRVSSQTMQLHNLIAMVYTSPSETSELAREIAADFNNLGSASNNPEDYDDLEPESIKIFIIITDHRYRGNCRKKETKQHSMINSVTDEPETVFESRTRRNGYCGDQALIQAAKAMANVNLKQTHIRKKAGVDETVIDSKTKAVRGLTCDELALCARVYGFGSCFYEIENKQFFKPIPMRHDESFYPPNRILHFVLFGDHWGWFFPSSIKKLLNRSECFRCGLENPTSSHICTTPKATCIFCNKDGIDPEQHICAAKLQLATERVVERSIINFKTLLETHGVEGSIDGIIAHGGLNYEQAEQKFSEFLAGEIYQCLLMTGPGGTGKSQIIKDAIHRGALPLLGTIRTAHFGVAAKNIDGDTLCTTFHLQPQGGVDFKSIPFFKVDKIAKAKYLVIDEYATIPQRLFQLTNEVCQLARKNDQLFGGLKLILCGDHLQLQDIESPGNPIWKSKLFNELMGRTMVIKMYETHRFKNLDETKDETTATMMSEIRLGIVKPATYAWLKSRKFSQLEIDKRMAASPIKPIYLLSKNKEVDRINQQAHEEYVKAGGIVFVHEVEHGSKFDSVFPNVPSRLELAVGERVICTKNLPNGLRNGMMGTVQHGKKLTTFYDCESDLRVPEILTGCDENSESSDYEEKSRRSDTVVVLFDSAIPGCSRTPQEIKAVSFVEKVIKPGGEYNIYRKQLPLAPASAITIHKSQGCTFSCPVITDLGKNMFAASQAYVALSRVSYAEQLYLLDVDVSKIRADPEAIKYELHLLLPDKFEHITNNTDELLSSDEITSQIKDQVIMTAQHNDKLNSPLFKNMVVFDLETAKNSTTKIHEVYAVGWQVFDSDRVAGPIQTLFQKHSKQDVIGEWLDQLIKSIVRPRYEKYLAARANGENAKKQKYFSPVTLCAYNGASFDWSFILKCLNSTICKLKQSDELLRNCSVEFNRTASGFLNIQVSDSRSKLVLLKSHDLARVFPFVRLKKLVSTCSDTVSKGEFPHEIMDDDANKEHMKNPDSLIFAKMKDFPESKAAMDSDKAVFLGELDPRFREAFCEMHDFGSTTKFPLHVYSDYYLRKDVESLVTCYQGAEEAFIELLGASIMRFQTVTQATWYAMLLNLPKKILLKDNRQTRTSIMADLWKVNNIESQVIEQAVYGGRVYPRQMYYKSKDFDAANYYEIEDYLLYGDAHELYAGCLKTASFGYGVHRWANEKDIARIMTLLHDESLFKRIREEEAILEQEDRLFPRCILQAKILMPPLDMEPCLPRRGADGSLIWDNTSRVGFYDIKHIVLAVKNGAVVEEIYGGLVWDKHDQFMRPWVEKAIQKKKIDISNPACTNIDKMLNLIGKLLSNALYGASLMRRISKHTTFAADQKEVNDFFNDFKVDDAMNMDGVQDGTENFLYLQGIHRRSPYTELSKKLPHLGVEVLAHSHRIYSDVVDKLLGSDRRSGRVGDKRILNGDTDSFFFTAECLSTPGVESVFGNDSGKLGCDVYKLHNKLHNDTTGFPRVFRKTNTNEELIITKDHQGLPNCYGYDIKYTKSTNDLFIKDQDGNIISCYKNACFKDWRMAKLIELVAPAPKTYEFKAVLPNGHIIEVMKSKGISTKNKIFIDTEGKCALTDSESAELKKQLLKDDIDEKTIDAKVKAAQKTKMNSLFKGEKRRITYDDFKSSVLNDAKLLTGKLNPMKGERGRVSDSARSKGVVTFDIREQPQFRRLCATSYKGRVPISADINPNQDIIAEKKRYLVPVGDGDSFNNSENTKAAKDTFTKLKRKAESQPVDLESSKRSSAYVKTECTRRAINEAPGAPRLPMDMQEHYKLFRETASKADYELAKANMKAINHPDYVYLV